MAKNEIILHKDELEAIGIEIWPIGDLEKNEQEAHRDDHFMFIIQQRGNFVWELDFQKVELSGSSIGYIAPGQVHRYMQYKNCEGWFVFVDLSLISRSYAEVFNTSLNAHQVAPVENNNNIFTLIPVFRSILKDQEVPFQHILVKSLADGLIGLIASALIQAQHAGNRIGSRKYKKVTEFKQLIQSRCRELKQVKDYAFLLHITPLYLNEIVKEISGFTASYLIQQEIILESQRLLYYTDLDIKEIAFELGYDDHAYFSRFFKKHTKTTASEFRSKKPSYIQS